jgi:hypothetical protein
LRCATRGLDCQDYVPKRRGRKRINSPEENNSPPNVSNIHEVTTGKDSNSSPLLTLGSSSSPISEETFENQELVSKVLDLPSDLFSELLFSPFSLDGYNGNYFSNHLPTSPLLNITPPSSNSSPLTPSSLMSSGSSPLQLTPNLGNTPKLNTPSSNTNDETPSGPMCLSSKYDENYKRFVEYIKSRVGEEERDNLEQSMWTVRHKVKVYIKESGRGTLSESLCIVAWRKDLSEQLSTLKELYDRVHIPTIVFERCGQLHYANDGNAKNPEKSNSYFFLSLFTTHWVGNCPSFERRISFLQTNIRKWSIEFYA